MKQSIHNLFYNPTKRQFYARMITKSVRIFFLPKNFWKTYGLFVQKILFKNRRIIVSFFLTILFLQNTLHAQTAYRRPSGRDFKNASFSEGVVFNDNMAFKISYANGQVLTASTGIAVDTIHGKVYLANDAYNRILRYDLNTLNANSQPEAVFGQDNFYSFNGYVPGTRNRIVAMGVAVDKEGNLYVAEGMGWAASASGKIPVNKNPLHNDRVTRYNKAYLAPAVGAVPDGVIGQNTFQDLGPGLASNRLESPFGMSIDNDFSLFVADRGNYRVLRFDNANVITYNANASQVLGQADFTSNTSSLTPSASRASFLQQTMISKTGTLYVVDRVYSRILAWNNVKSKANGANADMVFLQRSFDNIECVYPQSAHVIQYAVYPQSATSSTTAPNIGISDGTSTYYNPSGAGVENFSTYPTVNFASIANYNGAIRYTGLSANAAVTGANVLGINAKDSVSLGTSSIIALDENIDRLYVGDGGGEVTFNSRILWYDNVSKLTFNQGRAPKISGYLTANFGGFASPMIGKYGRFYTADLLSAQSLVMYSPKVKLFVKETSIRSGANQVKAGDTMTVRVGIVDPKNYDAVYSNYTYMEAMDNITIDVYPMIGTQVGTTPIGSVTMVAGDREKKVTLKTDWVFPETQAIKLVAKVREPYGCYYGDTTNSAIPAIVPFRMQISGVLPNSTVFSRQYLTPQIQVVNAFTNAVGNFPSAVQIVVNNPAGQGIIGYQTLSAGVSTANVTMPNIYFNSAGTGSKIVFQMTSALYPFISRKDSVINLTVTSGGTVNNYKLIPSATEILLGQTLNVTAASISLSGGETLAPSGGASFTITGGASNVVSNIPISTSPPIVSVAIPTNFTTLTNEQNPITLAVTGFTNPSNPNITVWRPKELDMPAIRNSAFNVLASGTALMTYESLAIDYANKKVYVGVYATSVINRYSLEDFSNNGNPTIEMTFPGMPTRQMSVDSYGSLYMSDASNGRIVRIDNAYSKKNTDVFVDFIIPGQANPCGLYVDAQRNVYVSNYSMNSVRRYKYNSTTFDMELLGSSGVGSDGKVVANAGSFQIVIDEARDILYVSNYANHSVIQWKNISFLKGTYNVAGQVPTYNFDAIFGRASATSTAGGTSQSLFSALNNQIGVSVDSDGSLYATDRGNHRVLIWNRAYLHKTGDAADGQIGVTGSFAGGTNPAANLLWEPAAVQSPKGYEGMVYVVHLGSQATPFQWAKIFSPFVLAFENVPPAMNMGSVGSVRVRVKKGANNYTNQVDYPITLTETSALGAISTPISAVIPANQGYVDIPVPASFNSGTLALKASCFFAPAATTSIPINGLKLKFDPATYTAQIPAVFSQGQSFRLKVKVWDKTQTTQLTFPSAVVVTIDTLRFAQKTVLQGTRVNTTIAGKDTVSIGMVSFAKTASPNEVPATNRLQVVAKATGYIPDTLNVEIRGNSPTQLGFSEADYAKDIYATDRVKVKIVTLNSVGGRSVLTGQKVFALYVKEGATQTAITDITTALGAAINPITILAGVDSLEMYVKLPVAYQTITQDKTIALRIESGDGSLVASETPNAITIRAPQTVLYTTPTTPLTNIALTNPQGIVVDENLRKVYVAESDKKRILRYSLDAFYDGATPEAVIGQKDLATIAAVSVEENRFNYPTRLALNPSGDLFVLDGGLSGANRVLRFPVSLASVSTGFDVKANAVFGQSSFYTIASGSGNNQFLNPTQMAIDNLGNLFVNDAGNNRVMIFSASTLAGTGNGKTADIILSGFTNTPTGVAADAIGNLFVADGNIVKVYTSIMTKSTGATWNSVLDFTPTSVSVGWIYCDLRNRLYVYDNTTNIWNTKVINLPAIRQKFTIDGVLGTSFYQMYANVTGRLYGVNTASAYRYATPIQMSITTPNAIVSAGQSFPVTVTLSAPAYDNVVIELDTASHIPSTKTDFSNRANVKQTIVKGQTTTTINAIFPTIDNALKITAKSVLKDYIAPATPINVSVLPLRWKFISPPSELKFGQEFSLTMQPVSPIDFSQLVSPALLNLSVALHNYSAGPASDLTGPTQTIITQGSNSVTLNGLSYKGTATAIQFKINPLIGYTVDTTGSIPIGIGVPLKLKTQPTSYRRFVLKGDSVNVRVRTTRDNVIIPMHVPETVTFSLLLPDGSIQSLTGSNKSIPTGVDSTSKTFAYSGVGKVRLIATGAKLQADTSQYITFIENLSVLYTNGAAAIDIIGQSNFTSSGANALSSQGWLGVNFPYALAVDEVNQKLYVSDASNYRILRFPITASSLTSSVPEAVFGQNNKISNVIPSSPNGFNISSPMGISVDQRNGRLYVVDYNYHRVIWYDQAHKLGDNPAISGVLGQASLTTNTSGTGFNKFNNPTGVAVASNGNVAVSDYANNRVLLFNAANISNGATANVVLGRKKYFETQTNAGVTAGMMNLPQGVTFDNDSSRMYVGDVGNNRILRYDKIWNKQTGDSADAVLGQRSFYTNSTAVTNAKFSVIRGLAYSGNRLFGVDPTNNRLLYFNYPHTKALVGVVGGGEADGVLGQSVFTTSASGTTATTLKYPTSIAVANGGNVIFIADKDNSRILKYSVANKLKITAAPFDPTQNNQGLVIQAGDVFPSSVVVQLQDITTGNPVNFTSNTTINIKTYKRVGDESDLKGTVSMVGIAGQNSVTFSNLMYPKSGNLRFIVYADNIVSDTIKYDIPITPLSLVFHKTSYSINQAVPFSNIKLSIKNSLGDTLSVAPDNLQVTLDTVPVLSSGYVLKQLVGTRVKQFNIGDRQVQFDNLTYSGSTAKIKLSATASGYSKAEALFNIIPSSLSKLQIRENYRRFVTGGEAVPITVFGVNASNNKSAATANVAMTFTDLTETITYGTATLPRGLDSINTSIVIPNNTAATIPTRIVVKATGLAKDTTNRFLQVATNTPENLYYSEAATLVVGKADFISSASNVTSSKVLTSPQAVVIDTINAKAYVADAANNRVLRYSVSNAYANGDAEYVFGQPNFTTKTSGTTSSTFSIPTDLAIVIDGGGRTTLFVADYANNRILRFDTADTRKINGNAANFVLGQANFTSSSNTTTQSGLNSPKGLAVDELGNLFVADTRNNRVLKFNNVLTKSNGDNADVVFGQPNFTTLTAATDAITLRTPTGVTARLGKLFVADYGNSRVMKFNSTASTNGTAATVALGQLVLNDIQSLLLTDANRMKGPTKVFLDRYDRLYVSDQDNNRIFRYSRASSRVTGDTTDLLLGQPSFNSSAPATSAVGLNAPSGISVDSYGRVYVADQNNNRVVRYGVDLVAVPSLVAQPSYVAGSPFKVLLSLKYRSPRFADTKAIALRNSPVGVDTSSGGGILKKALTSSLGLTGTIVAGKDTVTVRNLMYPVGGSVTLTSTSPVFKTDVLAVLMGKIKLNFTPTVAASGTTPRRLEANVNTVIPLTLTFLQPNLTTVVSSFPDNNVKVTIDTLRDVKNYKINGAFSQTANPSKPFGTINNAVSSVSVANTSFSGYNQIRLVASAPGLTNDTIIYLPTGNLADTMKVVESLAPFGVTAGIEQGTPLKLVVRSINKSTGLKAISRDDERILIRGFDIVTKRQVKLVGDTIITIASSKDSAIAPKVTYVGTSTLRYLALPLNTNSFLKKDTTIKTVKYNEGQADSLDIVGLSTLLYPSATKMDVKVISMTKYGVRKAGTADIQVTLQHGPSATTLYNSGLGYIKAGVDSVVIQTSYNVEVSNKNIFFKASSPTLTKTSSAKSVPFLTGSLLGSSIGYVGLNKISKYLSIAGDTLSVFPVFKTNAGADYSLTVQDTIIVNIEKNGLVIGSQKFSGITGTGWIALKGIRVMDGGTMIVKVFIKRGDTPSTVTVFGTAVINFGYGTLTKVVILSSPTSVKQNQLFTVKVALRNEKDGYFKVPSPTTVSLAGAQTPNPTGIVAADKDTVTILGVKFSDYMALNASPITKTITASIPASPTVTAATQNIILTKRNWKLQLNIPKTIYQYQVLNPVVMYVDKDTKENIALAENIDTRLRIKNPVTANNEVLNPVTPTASALVGDLQTSYPNTSFISSVNISRPITIVSEDVQGTYRLDSTEFITNVKQTVSDSLSMTVGATQRQMAEFTSIISIWDKTAKINPPLFKDTVLYLDIIDGGSISKLANLKVYLMDGTTKTPQTTIEGGKLKIIAKRGLIKVDLVMAYNDNTNGSATLTLNYNLKNSATIYNQVINFIPPLKLKINVASITPASIKQNDPFSFTVGIFSFQTGTLLTSSVENVAFAIDTVVGFTVNKAPFIGTSQGMILQSTPSTTISNIVYPNATAGTQRVRFRVSANGYIPDTSASLVINQIDARRLFIKANKISNPSLIVNTGSTDVVVYTTLADTTNATNWGRSPVNAPTTVKITAFNFTDNKTNEFLGTTTQIIAAGRDSTKFTVQYNRIENIKIIAQVISGIALVGDTSRRKVYMQFPPAPLRFVSVRDGNWGDKTIWDKNAVPRIIDTVDIQSSVALDNDISIANVFLTQGQIGLKKRQLTITNTLTSNQGIISGDYGTLVLANTMVGTEINFPTNITTLYHLTVNKKTKIGANLLVRGSLALTDSLKTQSFTLEVDSLFTTSGSNPLGLQKTANVIIGGGVTNTTLPAAITQLNQLTIQKTNAKSVVLSANLVVNDNVTLTSGLLDLQAFYLTVNNNFGITNGGFTGTAGPTGYKIKISEQSPTTSAYVISSQLAALPINKFEINRTTGAAFAVSNTRLRIMDSLVLAKGNVDLKSGVLYVGGYLNYANGTMSGILGPTGYKIVLDQTLAFTLPTKLYVFNKLTINKTAATTQITTTNDLIVLDTLTIASGQINRGSNVAIYGEVGNGTTYSNILPIQFNSYQASLKALKFTGTANLTVASPTALNPSAANALTIEGWIKMEQAPSSTTPAVVVSRKTALAGYELSLNSSGQMQAIIGSSTIISNVNSYKLRLNNWYHLAIAYNGTKVYFYVNGVVTDSNVVSGTLTLASQNAVIGSAFTGRLDEIRVWNKYISTAGVKLLMSNQLVGFESGLLGNYRFDNIMSRLGTSTTDSLYDYSTNNAHATFTDNTAITLVRSDAPVANFYTTPTASQTLPIAVASTSQIFTNVKQLKLNYTAQSSADSVRMVWYSYNPRPGTNPFGTDSLKKTEGYWSMTKLGEVNSMESVTFELPINQLVSSSFSAQSLLVFIYRYGPNDRWKLIPSSMIAASSSFKAQQAVPLRANLEVAMAVRVNVIATVRSGAWSDVGVWLNSLPPTIGDVPFINHSVVVDQNTAVKGIILNDINSQITINDGIKLTISDTIASISTKLNGGLLLQGILRIVAGSTTRPFIFSSNISKVFSLELNTKTLQLNANMMVLNSLTLEDNAIINTQTNTLQLQGGLTATASTAKINDALGNVEIMGTGSKMIWPSNIRSIENIIVNRTTGMDIGADFVVKNNLEVRSGSTLFRYNYGILAPITPTLLSSNIVPAILLDSTKSIRSLKLTNQSLAIPVTNTANTINYETKFRVASAVEAWAKVNSTATNNVIFSKRSATAGYELRIETGGIASFSVFPTTGSEIIVRSDVNEFVLKPNKWYHIAGIYQNDSAKIYIDGVRVGVVKQAGAGAIKQDAQQPRIGNTATVTTGGFSGFIDELRIWSGALQIKYESSVRGNMNAQMNGIVDNNLIAYYTMNEGLGDTLFSTASTQIPIGGISTATGGYAQSYARVGTVFPNPTATQAGFVSANASRFDFNSSLKGLSATNFGAASGTIYANYISAKPVNSSRAFLPSSLDSVKTTLGSWQIVTPVQFQPNTSNVTIQLILNAGFTLNADELRLGSLVYRKSHNSTWTDLGGIYDQTVGDVKIIAKSPMNLEGFTEIAFAVKVPNYDTFNNGDWATPGTWKANLPPSLLETPRILHNVTVNSPQTTNVLNIGSTGILTVNNSLTVNDRIDFEAVATSNSLIFSNNSTLTYKNNRTITLNPKISSIYNFNVNTTSDTLIINSNLTIRGKLSLDGGTVLVIKNAKLTIASTGSLEVINGLIVSQNARLVLANSQDITLPSQFSSIDTLEINTGGASVNVNMVSDLIVNKQLILTQGILNRKTATNTFQLLYKLLVQGAGSIFPAIPSDRSAAITALSVSSTDAFVIDKSITLDAAKFDFTDMTVNSWININDINSYLVSKIDGANAQGWGVKIDIDSSLVFEAYLSNSTVTNKCVVSSNGAGYITDLSTNITRNFTTSNTSFKLKKGVWYFITAEYNRIQRQMNIYINDVLVGQLTTPLGYGMVNATQKKFQIFTNFNGLVDELRIWNISNGANIGRTQMYKQLTGLERGLFMYYKFNEAINDTTFDNTLNQYNLKVSATQWATSNAPVSDFGNAPTQTAQMTINASPSTQKITFNFIGNSNIVGYMRLTCKTSTANPAVIRTFYYNSQPNQTTSISQYISAIVSAGYWEMNNLNGARTFDGSERISFKISGLAYNTVVDTKSLVIVYRIGTSSRWNILGSDISNDTISSTIALNLQGTVQYAIATRPTVVGYYKKVSYGSSVSNIQMNLRLESILAASDIQVQLVFGTDTKVRQERNLTAKIQVSNINGEKTATIPLPYKPNDPLGIEPAKTYYMKIITYIPGGLVDTLSNLGNLYIVNQTFPSIDVLTDQKQIANGTITSPISIMPTNLKDTVLRYSATVQLSSLVSTIKYGVAPKVLNGLPSNAFVAPFYWSISGNGIQFTNGKLYYPLQQIMNSLKDTLSVRWYRRDNEADTWKDVTDGKVYSNGIRQLVTKALTSFSDYVLVILESPPTINGYAVKDLNIDASTGKLASPSFISDIYTGSSDIEGKAIVGVDPSVSYGLVINTQSKPKAPVTNTILFTTTSLKTDTMYYYYLQMKNNQQTIKSGTNWFFTRTAQNTFIDLNGVDEGTYSFANSTAKHITYTAATNGTKTTTGTNFYVQGSFKNTGALREKIAFEKYVKKPLLSAQLPNGIVRVNPQSWILSPTISSYTINSRSDTTLVNHLMDRTAKQGSNQVGLSVSEFPSGTDFSKLVWIKRDFPSSPWISIGGKVQNQIFTSNESTGLMDMYGEYAIATISPAAAVNELITISDFAVSSSGQGKAIIQWRTKYESANLAGFDVIRMNGIKDSIIASFADNNNSLVSKQYTPSYYSVGDLGLKSGVTYQYRLRLYDKSGNIYESQAGIITLNANIVAAITDSLAQNYPNPVNGGYTVIFYSLKENQNTELKVYDALGKTVATLIQGAQEAGKHTVIFNTDNLPTGVYYYRLVVGTYRKTKKMVVIR